MRAGRVRVALDRHERPLHCHHEKVVIVDGEIAFVGGIDLTSYGGDRFDAPAHPNRGALGWHDVTTQVRGFDFVDAARASGAGTLTIVRVHVLGNVLGPILVYATSLISVAIILAAGLSFLGLGVKPPEPEWGLMLNTLRQAIYVNPLLAALPGVMIFLTSICFNLMSDGLRAAMDVKA